MAEYQLWNIPDFSGGINNKVDDNLINDNECSDAQNVVALHLGSLTQRKGQKKLHDNALSAKIQGLYPYYYGENGQERKLITVSDGYLYYYDEATRTFIKIDMPYRLDTEAPVEFATTVNYLVGFNGVNPPFKYDGTTVTALANAPEKGQYCIMFAEKLFTVLEPNTSTIVWSDSFQPESWPAVNYWDIGKGDGDYITGFREFLGDLVIFKQHSIYTLKGTSIDNFRMELVETNLGAVGARASVYDNMYLYHVANEGICAFNGVRSTNLTDAKIPEIWKNVNQEHLSRAAATRWNNMLWFSLPEGEVNYNNLVLVYDIQSKAWWKYGQMNLSCFTTYFNGLSLKLYGGSSVNGYVMEEDIGDIDESYDIAAPIFERSSVAHDTRGNELAINQPRFERILW